MKKSELKTGMLVELRDEDIYMVIGDSLVKDGDDIDISEYNDDLTDEDGINSLDIMRVSEIRTGIDKQPCYWITEELEEAVLWNREDDVPELTMKQAIEKMGFDFKIKK